jgi:hypothetical protein
LNGAVEPVGRGAVNPPLLLGIDDEAGAKPDVVTLTPAPAPPAPPLKVERADRKPP